MSSDGRRTGCIIAAVLGCAGALGAAVLVALVGWLFVSAPAAAPIADLPPEPTAVESEPAPDPDLTIRVSHTPYTIRGSSAAELRKQMDALGPTDAHGRYDAYTRWYVRWKYPYERTPNACGLGKVTVTVDVTYTLPEWTPPPDASADLVSRWNRYLRALRSHESGHHRHGAEAGRAVLEKLRRLEAQRRCEDADRRANLLGERVLETYRAKDQSYDKTTRHGATEGARFP